MNRFLYNLLSKLCIVLALAATGSARAEDALPSQDQSLAGALENHPDIVAAKARVAMANAELYGKRIEVSRQVLGLYGNLKKLDAQIDASKAVLSRSKAEIEKLKEAEAKGGTVDPSTKNNPVVEARAAEAQLVQAFGQREQAEKELRLLIGTSSPAAGAISPKNEIVIAQQTPQGPIVEKMKVVKEKPVKLEFVDTPLEEVMKYLTSSTGIMFSLQRSALEESGINSDEPISLHTNEIPLHAALQTFEDAYPVMQFVLRDYGVLLTTRDYVEQQGYVLVLEQAKESAATFESR